MATLVIDTATAACSVALIEGGRALASMHEVVGRGHAERLVPMVAELLRDRLDTPDAVLVDCGPGSFTGIRVGLAAARAFGLAWGCPVSGYSALAALAAAAGDDAGVAITGGHGELFVQRFAGGPLRPIDAIRSLSPADAAAHLTERQIVGSGAAALVTARGWGEAEDRLPAARDVVLLPPELTSLPPVPLYGRAPDAKIPQ